MLNRRLIDKHLEPGFFNTRLIIHFVYLLTTLSIKKRLDLYAYYVLYYNRRI